MSTFTRFEVPGAHPEGGLPPRVSQLMKAMSEHIHALYVLMPPGVCLEVRQKPSLIEVPDQPPLPPLTISRGAVTIDVQLGRDGTLSAPGDGKDAKGESNGDATT